MECRTRSYEYIALIISILQIYAKNRVFAANLCVVENKRVDFNIVCYEFWSKKTREKQGQRSSFIASRRQPNLQFFHKCRNRLASNAGTKWPQMPEQNGPKCRNKMVPNAGKV